MTFATSSPGASTAAGQGTTPPICQNCTTSTTPLWRRDEAGSVLCNACGLFLKLHGRPRPISLKTDVIKSRNRVKNSGQPQKKKSSLFDSPTVLGPTSTSSHPTPRSEAGTPPPGHHRHHHQQQQHHHRSVSPQSSRSGTPLPGIFDHSLLQHTSSGADSPPTLPSLATLNQPSPIYQQEPVTIDALIAANNRLKTRVAELELVNDLFRGRVGELENSEANARRAEIGRKEVEAQLRQCLDAASKREDGLKRRIDEMERELVETRGGSSNDMARKKVRVSDLTG